MTPAELREKMLSLPPPPAGSHPPLWDYWRRDLWTRVTRGDDPFGFMGWPCIYHTMLQNHWLDVVSKEATEMGLAGHGLYRASPAPPEKFYPADYLVPEVGHSANLLHQLYHWWTWERATGRQVADLSAIVEFGGGYGAMALMARRLGFLGDYWIYDLPEFQLLQEFFTSNCGVEVGFTWAGSGHSNLAAAAIPDLLVAGYSLSEVDYLSRDDFLTGWPARSYFFWYSKRFEAYDNIAYFQERVPALLPGYTWNHWLIGHMPPESWYTIAWTI